jgi:tetratricopeptide (TPR) repeat protein
MLKAEEIITIEEQWKEYKNRVLFKKLVAIFLVLIFLASLTLLFLVLKEVLKTNDEITKIQINNTSVIEQTSTATTNITIINENLENQSISDNNNIEINKSASIQLPVNTLKTVMPTANNPSKTDINTDDKQPFSGNEQPPAIQTIITPPIENKIFIETNDIQNTEELIKKFEASNNIVFATMISEEYFDRKEYRKSLEWALRANEIDPQNELSWIMFARNQVKLGKKEDAIRALEIYTNYTKDAANAINLLKNIRSGEYK